MNETTLTLAGSRQTGVRGAREFEIRQFPVTLGSLPPSLLWTRALGDAALLAGWAAPVLGLGPGWEREGGGFQQACNRLATCLQHACN